MLSRLLAMTNEKAQLPDETEAEFVKRLALGIHRLTDKAWNEGLPRETQEWANKATVALERNRPLPRIAELELTPEQRDAFANKCAYAAMAKPGSNGAARQLDHVLKLFREWLGRLEVVPAADRFARVVVLYTYDLWQKFLAKYVVIDEAEPHRLPPAGRGIQQFDSRPAGVTVRAMYARISQMQLSLMA